LEGAELVEQRLLEKDYEEVFLLFTTLHHIPIFTFFVFLEVFFPHLFEGVEL